MRCFRQVATALTAGCLLWPVFPVSAQSRDIRLDVLGSYAAGAFDQSAAEIAAHDPGTQRLFVVNGSTSKIDVLDIREPTRPAFLFAIDLSPFGARATSVAVQHGTLAVAVSALVVTDPGKAVFFDTEGRFLSSVSVGALPDMITFSPDGRTVLTANEGEPSGDYTVDPEGSVSIIDLQRGAERLSQSDVATAGFAQFDSAALDPSIRIFGPNASVAQDLEPEYIAVSHDSRTAWVTLQENNAIGILDIPGRRFVSLKGLGFKSHALPFQGLDASDRDGGIHIAQWPVFGMYQPDSIASFMHQGRTFLITANEGDARDYAAFREESRVAGVALDPVAFPDAAALTADARLGRLNVTTATGDIDGDGDFDRLFAFGARSFSIWSDEADLLYDSGDQLEQITARAAPAFFNAGNTNNARDDRSDNKGPEPEGVAVGELFGQTFAFIGLERTGGVMVFDITLPSQPRFVQYINNRDFSRDPSTPEAGDLGPEGLLFIPQHDSPTHQALLVVANEVSGTTTLYSISPVD